MSIISGIIDSILPPRCPVSGEIVDMPGMVASSVWSSLPFIAKPYCAACGLPFTFSAAGEEMLCATCLTDRPVFGRARAAMVYDDVSRDIILGFKHGDQTQNVSSFTLWMKQAGAELLAASDVLVPVPLHWTRLLKRRYNQSALMAQGLSSACGKPVVLDALRRVRATPTQGHLNPHEREQNVRKAFVVPPKRSAQIAGKRTLLIDDVYTTGATVSECARALLAAGADNVDVLTLARVVKPVRMG